MKAAIPTDGVAGESAAEANGAAADRRHERYGEACLELGYQEACHARSRHFLF